MTVAIPSASTSLPPIDASPGRGAPFGHCTNVGVENGRSTTPPKEIALELYVDEAFRFAGPTTKKLANLKNLLRQRCFLLAYRNLKSDQKLARLEKQLEDQAAEMVRVREAVAAKEFAAERKAEEAQRVMDKCREQERKLDREIAKLNERIKHLEEILQAVTDAKTARENELSIIRSQQEHVIMDAKEGATTELRRKARLQAEQLSQQIAVLEKELQHFRDRCQALEEQARLRSHEEQLKFANNVLGERREKARERMQRVAYIPGSNAHHTAGMSTITPGVAGAAAGKAGGGAKGGNKDGGGSKDGTGKKDKDASSSGKGKKVEDKDSSPGAKKKKKQGGANKNDNADDKQDDATPTRTSAGSPQQQRASPQDMLGALDPEAILAPRLTEEDICATIDACEGRFNEERKRWETERAELRMMYEQKALLHATQQATRQTRLSEAHDKMRDLEAVVRHFRAIEREHVRLAQDDKQNRVHALQRVTRISKLAKEESLGPLEQLTDIKSLRARAEATLKLKTLENETHRIARLMHHEKRMKPEAVAPTLLEEAPAEEERMWSVFGELRELDQTCADLRAVPEKLDAVNPPEDDHMYELPKPVFEFETLRDNIPDLGGVDDYVTAIDKLRRAANSANVMSMMGGPMLSNLAAAASPAAPMGDASN
ncbi:unnamed protein product [Amoebophrya sp. A25]|nr:unnamed protein product [Amoebophrya sp. A25]|eukprot:GSA25T00005383001.1